MTPPVCEQRGNEHRVVGFRVMVFSTEKSKTKQGLALTGDIT